MPRPASSAVSTRTSRATPRLERLDSLLELSPGATVSAVADVYPQPLTPRPLSLPFAEIERVLGVRYDPEQVLDVLSRLGFSPALDGEGDAATLRLVVPTWRSDVTMPADVVEEVARIIGYDTLPERLPIGQTAPVQRDPIYCHAAGRALGAHRRRRLGDGHLRHHRRRRSASPRPDGERSVGCPSRSTSRR